MANGQYEMMVYDDKTKLPLEDVVPVITAIIAHGVSYPYNTPLAATNEVGWTGFSGDDQFQYEITIKHPGYLTLVRVVSVSVTLPPPIDVYYLESSPVVPDPVAPGAFPFMPLLLLLVLAAALLQWRSD